MAFLPPVFSILQAAAPVTAFVGNRVYRHGKAPLGVAKPYVTWFLVTADPENQLSGVPRDDRQTVQVDAYSTGDTEIVTLSEAVRNALEPHAHMTATVADLFEPETALYRIGMQFDFWLSR